MILGAWALWIQTNKCVFDGASPFLRDAQQYFEEGMRMWSMAAAQKLQVLVGLP
jgi:hypothetical protein